MSEFEIYNIREPRGLKPGHGICSRKLYAFSKTVGDLLVLGKDGMPGFVTLSDHAFRPS